jgi:hypothetical protein
MIKTVLRKIGGAYVGQTPVDPSGFGDDLALKTEWTPASKGGANFRTHKLIQIDFSRVEFQASVGAKIFYSIFLVMGLALAAAFGLADRSEDTVIPVLFGLMFAAIGILLMYSGTTPIVFDKTQGYFWKGRKSPQDVVDFRTLKKAAPLDQIHALQLVAEYVRGNKTSYYSYELNLVLEDARRITVIDHGNLPRIRDDTQKLSEFLGKPVWDAIGGQSPKQEVS